MNKAFEGIFEFMNGLEIIDTHEHLPYSEAAREKDTDFLKEYLTHYFSRDLLSAGLKPSDFQKVTDHRLPLGKRWELVEPFWESCRNTGYGRSLDISVKALYGIEKICRQTVEPLEAAFQKSLKPGHFRRVLKEKSRIRVSLLDNLLYWDDRECDPEFFRGVYRVDKFIYPKTGVDIEEIENYSGTRICSFDDWLDACEAMLDRALARGAVALKSALAYQRTLSYDRTTRQEAEEGFNEIFKVKHIRDKSMQVFVVGKKFQDYMMHFILKLADRRKLVFQFHTGIQEGSGNVISNSDPALLSNLFLEYPGVDFDVFHMGYPFQQTVSVLAKNFPNVYIDMCWAHIISPRASIDALVEWVDSVPLNKISAFGGDHRFVDGICGHQYLARLNISKALAKAIEDGAFDLDRAKEVAEMLFYKNPVRLFKLEGKI